MFKLVCLIVALLTVACAAPESTPPAHQQWHLVIVAPVALQGQADAAGQEWNAALGRDVFVLGTGNEALGQLGHVYFRGASDEEMGIAAGWTQSETGHHFDVLVRGDHLEDATVYLHELGHVLGLDDLQDESDVMNASLTGRVMMVSDADVSGVYVFWGWNEQDRDF